MEKLTSELEAKLDSYFKERSIPEGKIVRSLSSEDKKKYNLTFQSIYSALKHLKLYSYDNIGNLRFQYWGIYPPVLSQEDINRLTQSYVYGRIDTG